MANRTITLNGLTAAFVSEANPDINYAQASYYNILKVSKYLTDAPDDLLLRKWVLIKFEDPPANIRRYKLVKGVAKVYLEEKYDSSKNPTIVVFGVDAFDPSTVTWNGKPSRTQDAGYVKPGSAQTLSKYVNLPTIEYSGSTAASPAYFAKYAATSGVGIEFAPFYDGLAVSYSSYARIYTPSAPSSRAPSLTITYDDSVTVDYALEGNGKTSGYVDYRLQQEFSWKWSKITSGIYSIGDPIQERATFYWKPASGGAYTGINVSGSTNTVTIPAYTFPSTGILWYVEAYDGEGLRYVTPTYVNTTGDSIAVATPLSPVSAIVDKAKTITFSWEISNDSGSTPTGSDIRFSEDGGDSWQTPIHINGETATYVSAENRFATGEVLWQVRAYNADGVAGNWSASASFIAYGAPEAPIVTADSAPFTTIRWQATGQAAYKITVDGRTYGPYGGTEKVYKLPEPLPDGVHTIRVYVQNQFGIVSDAGEYQTTIQNVPGTPIFVEGDAGIDIHLSWDSESSDDTYFIYRDGIKIGKTNYSAFTDRTALGAHEYYVLQALPGGYYTKSNVVTLTGFVDCPAIALLSGGEFFMLELSEDANRTQTITKTGEVAYNQYSGAKYPEAEIGEAESLTATGDVSFTAAQEADARSFESMLKKAVIYKTPGGEVVVGILQGFTRRDPRFFKSYSFQVTQMERRDFVNA